MKTYLKTLVMAALAASVAMSALAQEELDPSGGAAPEVESKAPMESAPASGNVLPKMFFTPDPPPSPQVNPTPERPTALRIRVWRGRNSADGMEWRSVNPKTTTFKPGDRLKFDLWSLNNGYLNVYNVDVNGKRNLLIPDPAIAGGKSFIRSKKKVQIPPPSAAGSFQIMSAKQMRGPTGYEKVDFFLVKDSARLPDSASRGGDTWDDGAAVSSRMVFVQDPVNGGQVNDDNDDGVYVSGGAGGDFLHYALTLKVAK